MIKYVEQKQRNNTEEKLLELEIFLTHDLGQPRRVYYSISIFSIPFSFLVITCMEARSGSEKSKEKEI